MHLDELFDTCQISHSPGAKKTNYQKEYLAFGERHQNHEILSEIVYKENSTIILIFVNYQWRKR